MLFVVSRGTFCQEMFIVVWGMFMAIIIIQNKLPVHIIEEGECGKRNTVVYASFVKGAAS